MTLCLSAIAAVLLSLPLIADFNLVTELQKLENYLLLCGGALSTWLIKNIHWFKKWIWFFVDRLPILEKQKRTVLDPQWEIAKKALASLRVELVAARAVFAEASRAGNFTELQACFAKLAPIGTAVADDIDKLWSAGEKAEAAIMAIVHGTKEES